MAGLDLLGAAIDRNADTSELRGAALSRLHGLDLHVAHRDLLGADFSGCVLEDTCFENNSLLKTDFRDIETRKVRFLNCNMRGVRFDAARLGGALFDGCDLRDARFERADLSGSRFIGCVMSSCSFRDANLGNAGFRDAVVADADFQGANLLYALFASSVVDGAKLDAARNFFLSRALVTEALRQKADGVLERLREVALVDQLPEMCWDAWLHYGRDLEMRDPLLFQWVMDTFAAYPASRMTDAFLEGWAWARHGALREVAIKGTDSDSEPGGER